MERNILEQPIDGYTSIADFIESEVNKFCENDKEFKNIISKINVSDEEIIDISATLIIYSLCSALIVKKIEEHIEISEKDINDITKACSDNFFEIIRNEIATKLFKESIEDREETIKLYDKNLTICNDIICEMLERISDKIDKEGLTDDQIEVLKDIGKKVDKRKSFVKNIELNKTLLTHQKDNLGRHNIITKVIKDQVAFFED